MTDGNNDDDALAPAEPEPEWLTEALTRLPRELEPGRDLWPGIAARIAQADAAPEVRNERRARAPWWWQAAAAVALVAGSSLVTALLIRPGSEPPGLAQSRQPATPAPADDAADYLPPEYLIARYEMTQALDSNLDGVTPETRRIVERNLREIQRGLEEIGAALRRDPSNPTLQKLLLAATEQELEYLNKLRRMTEETT